MNPIPFRIAVRVLKDLTLPLRFGNVQSPEMAPPSFALDNTKLATPQVHTPGREVESSWNFIPFEVGAHIKQGQDAVESDKFHYRNHLAASSGQLSLPWL